MTFRASIGPTGRLPVETYGPVVPTAGSTVTVPSSPAAVVVAMVNPAALLLSLNIDMPAGTFHGQIIRFTFSNPITTIVWTSQLGNILNSLSSAIVGGYCAFAWDAVNSYWRRIT